MASYNKFNSFVADIANKVMNLGSDSLKIALTNTLPVATNSVLANISEISYTNLSSRVLTQASSAQTAGLYSLIVNDLVLTSTGGTTGPFRYIVIYDDTSASKSLIAWFDYGSSITLGSGETLTLDFDNVNGVLQLQ